MLVLHHLENSRSQRVLWLLEELGLDYDIKTYFRDKETSLAPAALKDVHPLGKSPVLEADGVVIAETAAIIEYLIDTHGPNWRPSPSDGAYRDYIYWLHFAEGSFMPQLLLMLFFTRIKEAKMPFFAKPIARGVADKVLSGYVQPNLASQFSFIEDHLSKHEWFAGSAISGADVMMIFPMEAAKSAGRLDDAFPNCKKYVQRIHDLPAYQAALERGGPYSYV